MGHFFWTGVYVHGKLSNCDVCVIFERCFDHSVKGCTHGQRTAVRGNQHHLTLQSPVPIKSVSLTVTDYKVKIIDIICKGLLVHFQEQPCDNRLIITS